MDVTSRWILLVWTFAIALCTEGLDLVSEAQGRGSAPAANVWSNSFIARKPTRWTGPEPLALECHCTGANCTRTVDINITVTSVKLNGRMTQYSSHIINVAEQLGASAVYMISLQPVDMPDLLHHFRLRPLARPEPTALMFDRGDFVTCLREGYGQILPLDGNIAGSTHWHNPAGVRGMSPTATFRLTVAIPRGGAQYTAVGTLKHLGSEKSIKIPPRTPFFALTASSQLGSRKAANQRLRMRPPIPRDPSRGMDDEIIVFAARPHAHRLKQAMCTTLQDGKGHVLHHIFCVNDFSGSWIPLRFPVRLTVRDFYRGPLVTAAVYNSSGESTWTSGGKSTLDEMFISHVQYYPWHPLLGIIKDDLHQTVQGSSDWSMLRSITGRGLGQ
mmetsp:Transcript_24783/g.83111  ORF Transcript_24783/g.83111 Transcript_24783/m.83111 type:complete len:387 (-) Transcript_24783:393-1553(-)